MVNGLSTDTCKDHAMPIVNGIVNGHLECIKMIHNALEPIWAPLVEKTCHGIGQK